VDFYAGFTLGKKKAGFLLLFEKANKRFYCDFVIPETRSEAESPFRKAGIQLKTPGFRLKAGMTERHPLSKCLN